MFTIGGAVHADCIIDLPDLNTNTFFTYSCIFIFRNTVGSQIVDVAHQGIQFEVSPGMSTVFEELGLDEVLNQNEQSKVLMRPVIKLFPMDN